MDAVLAYALSGIANRALVTDLRARERLFVAGCGAGHRATIFYRERYLGVYGVK